MTTSNTAMTGTIRIDGREVVPAKVIGGSNRADRAFGCMPFFAKPRWVADDECGGACHGCEQKFNQIRRKHHCRHCGQIFCNACCNFKVPLPQFGLDEPQRVCTRCLEVASLVAKARSPYVAHWQEAANGLTQLIQSTDGLLKFLSGGGAQTLIALGAQGDGSIKASVASGLEILSRHQVLHPLLLDIGVLRLIKHILQSCSNSPACSAPRNEAALRDAMTTLIALASSSAGEEIRSKILEEGVVEALLPLIPKWSPTSLLAARVLHQLVEKPDTHPVLEKNLSLVPNLMETLNCDGQQMRQTVLRIFGCLSASSQVFRQRLISEDSNLGTKILQFLTGGHVTAESRDEGDGKASRASEDERRVLVTDALWVIGNLATCNGAEQQAPLQPYLSAACDLLYAPSSMLDDLLRIQLARTLANFAEFRANQSQIVQHVPAIVSVLLVNQPELARLHACRLITALVAAGQQESAILDPIVADNDGVKALLTTLFGDHGICEAVCGCLVRKGASRFSMPKLDR